ncbi:hypothetical protein DCO58_10295 [Helicobacter saguini]|uniref:G domain-containing protein n=1 Tax=Helicobacter saguini TaxID=1548018 RepID=A0A347VPL6_9HELI|nr:GTPase [Helicobacter saguini]MWV61306.1 hypothetical protein [Helicobacter saguini]MWV68025.1 hypothetical protein [Helicobacter saguini]MWV70508.1 hypothetical protein [Helicobacter saguini]MWV72411.1 hypothetical protein [Helicobacter saguini]TLD91861.1 hypothetical protein LS64_011325 [Helicobacter saguini]
MSFNKVGENDKQKDFYKNVRENLNNVRVALLKSDENYESEDKEKLQEALSIFANCEEKANKDLAKLEKNAEWKRLNIAFYGETNAGKSTLIESLRLYFKDDKKINEQEKFKEAYDKFAESKVIIDSITNEIKNLEDSKVDIKSKKDILNNSIQEIKKDIQDIESIIKQENDKLESKQKEQNKMLDSKSKLESNKIELDSITNENKDLENLKLDSEKQKIQKESDLPNIAKNMADIESKISQIQKNIESNPLSSGGFFNFFKKLFKPSLNKELKALKNSKKELEKQKQNEENKEKEIKQEITKYETIIAESIKNIESNKIKQHEIIESNNILSKEIINLDSITNEISQIKDCINNHNDKIKIKNTEIEALQQDINKEDEKIRQINANIESKHTQKNQIIESNRGNIESMVKNRDGLIIGTGQSDFTRDITIYDFTHNGNDFSLIDVPGIEGNETIVIDEIYKALSKAHAIFYVKKEHTPPQKGDENKKGIIEKIKEQLNDQAEIYTIFNKPINNARMLENEFIDSQTRQGLNELDSKMDEYLGEFYKGHKVLSAQLAFYSLAKNLLDRETLESFKQNTNIALETRDKLLKNYTSDSILSMTHFNEFSEFVSDLNQNAKEKIKNAHIKKAKSIIIYFKDSIREILKQKYEPLLASLQENLESTNDKLDYIQEQFIKKCKASANDIVDKNISKIKRETYAAIESNIKDDVFKKRLESNIDNTMENHLKPQLADALKQRQQELEKYIKEELENYQKRMQECVDKISHLSIKDNFGNSLDIKIDSGIEFGGLAMGVATIGTTILTGMALGWNPIGWVILGAGIITGILSIGKSVLKFFSDDYKKSEQKKATDSALRDISSKVKTSIVEQIDSNKDSITNIIDEIKAELAKPLEKMEQSIKALKKIQKELRKLESNIENLL